MGSVIQGKLSSLRMDLFSIQQYFPMIVLFLRASAILVGWILCINGSQVIWDDLDMKRDASFLSEGSPHMWHL